MKKDILLKRLFIKKCYSFCFKKNFLSFTLFIGVGSGPNCESSRFFFKWDLPFRSIIVVYCQAFINLSIYLRDTKYQNGIYNVRFYHNLSFEMYVIPPGNYYTRQRVISTVVVSKDMTYRYTIGYWIVSWTSSVLWKLNSSGMAFTEG